MTAKHAIQITGSRLPAASTGECSTGISGSRCAAHHFTIRSSGCNEIEDIRIAFRSHVWDAGEPVKERDDAATEFCDFREGVNFPASVGRDEGLPHLHVGS